MQKRGSVKTKFSLVSFSKGKRGMIEVHFNWIFVLIAGAIIFLFFINIVNKQREFSEIKTSGTIITSLESILTGAQVSTRTVNEIDLPKVDIGFECDRYFIGPVPKQTKGNVIFSPSLLKGKKMITWALDWSMPYRITNFLYVTDPEVRYIIANKSDRPATKIFDELPKELNKELINPSINIINKNNYKVKFIFFDDIIGNVPASLNEMPDEDVTAIVLDTGNTNEIPSTGAIKFYKKKGLAWEAQKSQNQEETYYLKKESLLGAIFAENLEMYNCAMKKAFKKLSLVTKIYLDRSSTLAEYYWVSNFNCATQHSGAVNQISSILSYSEGQAENFPDPNILNINKIEEFAYRTADSVWSYNRNAQLYSCALIY